jgi:hypothetical protein
MDVYKRAEQELETWRARSIAWIQSHDYALYSARQAALRNLEEYDRLKELVSDDFFDGFITGAKKAALETKGLYAVGKDAFERLSSDGSELLINWAFGLETNWRQTLSRMLTEWAKFLAQLAIKRALAEAFGGEEGSSGSGVFGFFRRILGLAGTATGTTTGGGGFFNDGGVQFAHQGGLIGSTVFPSTSVNMGVFAGARRYHNGGRVLGADEVPIIAKKGEEIGYPGQGTTTFAPQFNLDIKVEAKGGSPITEEDGKVVGQAVKRELEGFVQTVLDRESRPGGRLFRRSGR